MPPTRLALLTIVLLALTCPASPASAQEPSTGPFTIDNDQLAPLVDPRPPLLVRAPETGPRALRRPAALVPLYVSLAGLQLVDLTQTLRGVAGGARELNPATAQLASNRAAFAVLKGSATAGAVVFTERLWKKNRTAAIVAMVALNSTMAAVVARNQDVLRR